MSQVIYEKGDYYVIKSNTFVGFEVYKNTGTHSQRVARIGFSGQAGLDRAKAEIDRRMA